MYVLALPKVNRDHVTIPSTKMDSAFEDVSERESSAACLNFRNKDSGSSIAPVTGLKKSHKHISEN